MERSSDRTLTIGLIGTRPPPLGGISVHIDRLYRRLGGDDYNGILFDSFAGIDEANLLLRKFKNQRWRLSLLRPSSEITEGRGSQLDLIHCHNNGWLDVAWTGMVAKLHGIPAVVTFHSLRLPMKGLSRRERGLAAFAFRTVDRFVAVSEVVAETLISLGCEPDKISVIPAFIPGASDGSTPLPKAVEAFIERAEFLVVANGPMRIFESVNMYGFDLLVEALAELKNRGREVHLLAAVIQVATMTDEARKSYQELVGFVEDNGLQEQVLFYETDTLDFNRLLPLAQAFVRPTNTDGDALSVREALFAKLPCIASDASWRPRGTLLFSNRDALSLATVLESVVLQQATCPEDADRHDYYLDLRQLYRSLMTGQ